jgi:protease-4
MKVNPLLNEISRGLWAMSFDGLQHWGIIAHKIMSGEAIALPQSNEVKSLISYFDENINSIKADQDGNMAIPKGSIAVVDMIGAIIKYGDWCTYGADEIVKVLKAADKNPNIAAIVLNIDGPGGSVSAIAPFVEFGKMKTKPVIGLYDQCCSAHLYAMYSCCDHIMASNDISATIGSVGVVLSFKDNQKYLETLGYTFHDIYPKESEAKNQAFLLALDGKYDMIKDEMLSPLAINFQNAVKKARPNLNLREPGVITGKTFYTDKAIGIGLADSMGSLEDAINLALVLSEMKSLYKSNV